MRTHYYLATYINGKKVYYAGGNYSYSTDKKNARGYYKLDNAISMRDELENTGKIIFMEW